MISPFTPPGTRVVLIYKEPISILEKGHVYTVEKVAIGVDINTWQTKPGVYLQGIAQGGYGFSRLLYDLEHFEYAALPDSITRLLETAPTRTPSELEPMQ